MQVNPFNYDGWLRSIMNKSLYLPREIAPKLIINQYYTKTMRFILPFLVLLMFSACVPKKKIIYMQNIDEIAINNYRPDYEPTLQPDDMLFIQVSSLDPEASIPFNIQFPPGTPIGGGAGDLMIQRQTYLVDQQGILDFPILGQLQVGGMKKSEFETFLKAKLSAYIKDPVLNIRYTNFSFTVLGEVARPGVITARSERVTLYEALGMAGDLTIFGKRDNVLIIRENEGVRSYHRVDLTKADVINSPFYYLDQNDVVYVEPRKSKIDGTAVGSNVTVGISILSFIITTTLLLTR